jgi:hypothetical protein
MFHLQLLDNGTKYITQLSNDVISLKFTYFTNQLTNLTTWTRVFEKPVVTQVVKKFPGVYETREFITVLERARQYSLS